MNWKSFLYKSKSPTTYTPYYHHWLPENQAELLPFPLTDGDDLPEYYENFDSLVHVTTFENATDILKNGFKPRVVSDNSVVSCNMELLEINGEDDQPVDCQHPIYDKSVIWYGPIRFENNRNETCFER